MQAITERLLDGLARPLFPVAIPSDAPRFQSIAMGLLARVVDMAESALVLSARDRQGDLGILARCLFEHVVMLGWLAGAEGRERYERMLLWQRYDDEQRLRIDREVSSLQGEPLLPSRVDMRPVKRPASRSRSLSTASPDRRWRHVTRRPAIATATSRAATATTIAKR